MLFLRCFSKCQFCEALSQSISEHVQNVKLCASHLEKPAVGDHRTQNTRKNERKNDNWVGIVGNWNTKCKHLLAWIFWSCTRHHGQNAKSSTLGTFILNKFHTFDTPKLHLAQSGPCAENVELSAFPTMYSYPGAPK